MTTARKKLNINFEKYARPDLIEAISRVTDFFGDAITSVVIPPACLIGLTLLLSYFLPFSNALTTVLFLVCASVIFAKLTFL